MKFIWLVIIRDPRLVGLLFSQWCILNAAHDETTFEIDSINFNIRWKNMFLHFTNLQSHAALQYQKPYMFFQIWQIWVAAIILCTPFCFGFHCNQFLSCVMINACVISWDYTKSHHCYIQNYSITISAGAAVSTKHIAIDESTAAFKSLLPSTNYLITVIGNKVADADVAIDGTMITCTTKREWTLTWAQLELLVVVFPHLKWILRC